MEGHRANRSHRAISDTGRAYDRPVPPTSEPVVEHARTWAGTADGETYEQGRPDYPPALTALLSEQIGLTLGRRVIDVAAGTGKLTRRLLTTGAEVLAAEPMAGMRAALRQAVPATTVMAATAETLPLADATVDGVTVAQAFHWFDVPRATAEFRRVLRPGGHLAVINNRRDDRVAWVERITEILGRYERFTPRPASTRRWLEELQGSDDFGDWREFDLPHAQRFASLADFDARFLSISSVILLDPERKTQLIEELHDSAAGIQPLVMPLRTTVRIGTRR
jgi:SAM-dependent methyltransferase